MVAIAQTLVDNPNKNGGGIMNIDDVFSVKEAVDNLGVKKPTFMHQTSHPETAKYIEGIVPTARMRVYTRRMLEEYKAGNFPVRPLPEEIAAFGTDIFMTIGDAAVYLGIPENTLKWHAITSDPPNIKSKKVGHARLFHKRDLDDFSERESQTGRQRGMTDDQVRTARELGKGGATLKQLATLLGTSESNVSRILSGERYPDAGGPIRGEDY